MLLRPNKDCPVKANLRCKGKSYDTGDFERKTKGKFGKIYIGDENLCINDSCM